MDRECLICGAWHSHLHHTLPKSVWPQHRDNPANLIPLCYGHHMDWHAGRAVVHREDLPATTWRLIKDNASTAWCDRWYPPRPSADLPF